MISTGDSLANSDDATSLLGASLRTVLVLVGSSALVEIDGWLTFSTNG